MIRVLFIARYRDATMRRKIDYLAREPDIELCYVTPAQWQDDLLRVAQPSEEGVFRQLAIPIIGKPADPHRALFRTIDFAMRSFKPHIIHAEEEPDSLSALQIAWARHLFAPGARLYLHTWQNVDRPKSLAVRWVMRQTLTAANLVFCANQEAAALLRRYGFGCPLPTVPAVGVDTEVFTLCPPRQCLAADAPLLGYVGRFVPEKGIDILIQAFAILHQTTIPFARLRLIGAGPQQSLLATQAAELGIADAVEFVAPMPPAQIAQAMCALDVLILPSRTTPVWKEQLGRVLLEAMACGIPVIGSDSGAIPEVIGDAGLVFSEGNAVELAHRIEQVLTDPELHQQCSQRGIERAHEHYSQQVLATKTVAFYRQMLP